MIKTLTTVFVAINALVWMAFGPVFYFATESAAAQLDIALNSPTALADFRAMYGGMPLGGGILMAMALWRKEWSKPVLMFILLGTTGLLVGRLITMVSPGGVGTEIYVFSALEIGTIVIGLWLYREYDKA
jgi:hypothetical protein